MGVILALLLGASWLFEIRPYPDRGDLMGVEFGAMSVDWNILLAKIVEKPGRLRKASFLFTAEDKGESWVEGLSDSLDPTDSTMFQTANAYDRVRALFEVDSQAAFDRFAGAFFWFWTEQSPFDHPSVRDLGEKSDVQICFSRFSPESVDSYLETWKSLDLEALRKPFEVGKGHLAYRGSKARNTALFEGRFKPYFDQWGGLLEAASSKRRGLIVSFM